MRFISRHICVLAFAALLLLSTKGTSAWSDNRVALVVGNGAYENISTLRNARGDAELMTTTLEAIGFEVHQAFDVDRRDMARVIREFGTALRAAGPNTVALFYYAGHGVEYAGINYLIPLDAHVESAADLSIEAFRVSDVMRQMEEAGNSINLAILDACRNNPFPGNSRSSERGLARVSAFNGSLIAFAAAPGEVAMDGEGSNSPYTLALAEAMQYPGLTIEQVFKRTRGAVVDATSGAQTPWEESALIDEFYLVPGDPSNGSLSNLSEEALLWESVRNSNDAALLEDFLRRFPDGLFATVAAAKLKGLLDQVAIGVFPEEELQFEDEQLPCAEGFAIRVAGAIRCVMPGDEFRDCAACPTMVVLPAGSYVRGAPVTEEGANNWDKLQHNITLPAAFAVGKFEVTFDEWNACLHDVGCNNPISNDGGWGRGTRPVLNVTWNDAKEYAAWLESRTDAPYRLVTETEWEYAARAGSQQPYHFGSDQTALCEFGNIADRESSVRNNTNICSDGYPDQTAPVGSFKPNGFGLHDMIGNVHEWVEDCTAFYAPDYTDGRARTTDCHTPDFRMLRGGSWSSDPLNVRSANRYFSFHDFGSRAIGFRIARTLEIIVP